MPAIQVKKGGDIIAIEQRYGEDVEAKIAALVEEHGGENVLLDGKPVAQYRADQVAAAAHVLESDSNYQAGYKAGHAAALGNTVVESWVFGIRPGSAQPEPAVQTVQVITSPGQPSLAPAPGTPYPDAQYRADLAAQAAAAEKGVELGAGSDHTATTTIPGV